MADRLPIRTKHAMPAVMHSLPQSTVEASQVLNRRDDVKAPHMLNDRLVVACDFGTTFSGIAAAYSATPDDVEIIKTWPGGNGITSDKVPSEISYDNVSSQRNGSDDKSISRLSDPLSSNPVNKSSGEEVLDAVKWGFQLKPGDSRLRCLKLFLDRNQRLPSYVSPIDTAEHLRMHGRNVMDAIADYLTLVRRHVLETLTRRYGEAFMAQTPVEYVMTVPAVWSDQAKQSTLIAAEKAGMGSRDSIRLISEPEAAAVYTIQSLQPSFLGVGNNFVVCDAGGGTVDLIAYRITSTSPLMIEESAVGTGALCGSVFLNYRFEDHVRTRIGSDLYDNMRKKKPKAWQMGLKHFEEFVKRNFGDEETQEVNIPFPGLPDDEEAGLDSGFLTMTTDQVKSIFDPIVKQVVDLVDSQVDAIKQTGGTVSAVILVGGFGQSNYLYSCLKRHFLPSMPPPYTETPKTPHQTDHAKPIEIVQPMYAWTAVVRGAVLRGLEGSIVSNRLTRMHYGTTYATVFDQEKHPIADRYWSPLWERWMVSDRMQWHLAKGQPVSERTPISFHYTRNFRPGQSLVVEDDLIACETDDAPDSFTDVMYSVCTLKTDLGVVPKSHFTRLTTSKGVEFDNLNFTLDMIIDSADIIFELKVDGMSYGRVQADFH